MTPSSVARLKALVAVVVWGASFPSMKVAVAEVSYSTVICVRFGAAALALVLYLAFRKRLRLLPSREMWAFVGLGFLGIFFHNSLQAYALQTVSASMSGLIIAANPIVIALLGSLLLSERLEVASVAGILLAAVGVLIIISRGDMSALVRLDFSLGETIVALSVFTWGFFSVLSRKALQRTPPELGLAYALTFGWLFSTIPFLLSGGAAEVAAISGKAWANILFLGLICSALAYLFWYEALQTLPASEVGVFLYVNPVVTLILSVILLGETVTISMVVGGLLVFAGVWCVNTLPRILQRNRKRA